MTDRKFWPVALAVPFVIVGIVWAFAGIFLFLPAPYMETSLHASAGEPVSDIRHIQKNYSANIGYRQSYLAPQMGYRPNSFAPPQAGYQQPQRAVPSTAGAPDYLSAVDLDGNFRWSADRLPLHVYIDDGRSVSGYQTRYRTMLENAFDEWCNTSNGVLSWTEVSNPKQAEVVCTWTSNATIRPGSVEAGQTKTLIQQNRNTGEGQIMTAQINILTELMGRPFNDDAMQKTCLHEVGHALGLQGHSDVSSDIMYPMVNETQVAQLKQRDINTLARLYSDGAANTVAQAPRIRNMRGGFDGGANGGFYGGTNGGAKFSQDNGGGVAYDDRQGGSGVNVPPWMNQTIGQAQGNSIGPRNQMWGWDRRAAYREMMMRRAAAQNNFYN